MGDPHLVGWRRYAWILVLVWLVIIFLCSADSGSNERSLWLAQHVSGQTGENVLGFVHLALRKCGHLLEFAVLYGLLRIAGCKRWYAAGFALLYGASDELHQLFVPTRLGSFIDVAVDAFGILLGIGLEVAGRWAWLRR